MRAFTRTLPVIAVALALAACGGEQGEADPSGAAAMADGSPAAAETGAVEAAAEREGQGEGGAREGLDEEGEEEHGESGHDEGSGEGEEGGAHVSIDDAWDQTRNGVRLTLVYDPGYDQFIGQAMNTTGAPLCQVRVEVHLEGGPELGPTFPLDVAPGASIPVELPVQAARFETWTAHTETSPCG